MRQLRCFKLHGFVIALAALIGRRSCFIIRGTWHIIMYNDGADLFILIILNRQYTVNTDIFQGAVGLLIS